MWLDSENRASRANSQLEFKLSSSKQGEDLEEEGKDSNTRME